MSSPTQDDPPLCPHSPMVTPLYVLTSQDDPPLCPHSPMDDTPLARNFPETFSKSKKKLDWTHTQTDTQALNIYK